MPLIITAVVLKSFIPIFINKHTESFEYLYVVCNRTVLDGIFAMFSTYICVDEFIF